MTRSRAETALDIVEGLVVLVVRGVLLWLVIPVSVLVWLVLAPARLVRRVVLKRRHPSLSAHVHWADDIVTYTIERAVTVGRPDRRREIGLVRPAWPTPSTDRRGATVWDDAVDLDVI